VPAVRTLVMVSPDAFQKQLVRLGLPMKESGDYYGYSLALGSAEVTLLDLTNAYRALANGGVRSDTTLTARPASARSSRSPTVQALDPRAAFIVGDILSDPNARARTFGTDSILATRFWTAVKTGTSKDMRDNWAVGYSQRYTVGVWVGNASGAPMWDVSGISGAAPVWAALMQFLHQAQPSRAPKPPAGVVQKPVLFAADANAKPSGTPSTEAARSEWFLNGTQQTSFAMEEGATRATSTTARGQKDLKTGNAPTARITSPSNGTIIALDPDIPPHNQLLTLQAEGRQVRWRLDGKPLAQGNTALWLPWPGRHHFELTDAKGKLLDEVRVEVRGAGVKEAAR
jgi:penicillin-binding protein 1C